MNRTKILVAGIDYSPNQFTRQLEKTYGCETVHIDGGGGNRHHRSIPVFADAAFVVSSFVGHDRYWTVKEEYKKRGKPVFNVRDSVFEARERFEAWLLDHRGFIYAKDSPLASIGELTVPTTWVDPRTPVPRVIEVNALPPHQPQAKDEAMKNTEPGVRYTDEEIQLRDRIIKEEYKKGFDVDKAVQRLNTEGPKKRKGTSWKRQDVYMRVQSMRLKGMLPMTDRMLANLKDQAEEPIVTKAKAPAAPKPEVQSTIDPMLLIQQISGSDLDALDKVKLIAKVSMGEIKTAEFVDRAVIDGQLYIEKVSILRAKDKNPNLTLTVEQARLALDNLAALNEFVTKGQV